MKCILCVLLFCVIVLCGDCFAEDSWTVNTIAYDVDSAPSIAVDINNNPIAAFTLGNIDPALYTAAQTPAGYQVERVADIYPAFWPKIMVNSNNETSITFCQGSEIWYAVKGSWFGWSYWRLDGLEAGYQDISLTDNDIPHLAYVNPSTRYVEHAFFDIHSQQWQRETLSGMGQMQTAYACIDTDGSGRILISCFDYSKAETFCAIYEDGFWKYLPAVEGFYSDCSFTSDGLPAIAYSIKRTLSLCYAVYVNDIIGWVETKIAPTTPQFKVSLRHSSTGIAGIAYIYQDKLMYAANVAGGWTTVQIDERGAYPELIFDRNDKPLIAYSSYDYCIDKPVIKLAGIGLEGFNITDLNNDKIVNFRDFAILAEYWLTALPEPDLTIGDFDRNAKIDALDLRWLGCNWLWQGD
ncbi:MAG: dockerin type I domain-containing protein [Phycisphaerae bacterium]